MRPRPFISLGLWTLLLSGATAFGWSAFARMIPTTIAAQPVHGLVQPAVRRYAAESLGHVVEQRDLFRLARAPAATGYDPLRGAGGDAPPPPKPALALVGIVLGTQAAAVIEGLPGVEGPRVVRRGETVGALSVRDIRQDHVIVVGLDTTWTLKIRSPWN